MDEIAMFADLRPNDTLTDADLADIRAELFPDLEPNATAPDGVDLEVFTFRADTDSRPRHRWSRSVATAAAAVAVFGIGGLWLAANRDEGSAPAVQPSAPAVQPSAPPPATQPSVSNADAQSTPETVAASTPSSLSLCTGATTTSHASFAVLADVGHALPHGPRRARELVTDWLTTVQRRLTRRCRVRSSG